MMLPRPSNRAAITSLLPPRFRLAPDLDISRMVTGLWQVADMERDGRTLDPDQGAADLAAYAAAGFDSFDMADHYGSAEIIAGRFLALARQGKAASPSGMPATAFTKWCPEPGPMTDAVVRAGVQRSLDRMGLGQVEHGRIDLLQLHWWMYEHPAYLDAMATLAKLQEEGRIGHI